jgi:two-component system, OmpR family, sensor kinase
VGIEPAEHERFARAEPGRQRADGTGLGLAIVAAIAGAHRGRVAVDSRPGQGSTFTISIPLQPAATVAAAVPA